MLAPIPPGAHPPVIRETAEASGLSRINYLPGSPRPMFGTIREQIATSSRGPAARSVLEIVLCYPGSMLCVSPVGA